VIHVEKRALRAFEEDALAVAPRRIEKPPDTVDVWPNLRSNRREVGMDISQRNLGLAEAAPQRVVMKQETLDLGAQDHIVGKVDDPDGTSSDLVLICRPDATPGRP
jgi:hypothetical protein